MGGGSARGRQGIQKRHGSGHLALTSVWAAARRAAARRAAARRATRAKDARSGLRAPTSSQGGRGCTGLLHPSFWGKSSGEGDRRSPSRCFISEAPRGWQGSQKGGGSLRLALVSVRATAARHVSRTKDEGDSTGRSGLRVSTSSHGGRSCMGLLHASLYAECTRKSERSCTVSCRAQVWRLLDERRPLCRRAPRLIMEIHGTRKRPLRKKGAHELVLCASESVVSTCPRK